MEIRVSRRALAWLVRGGVLLPGALVSLFIFGLLGTAVTPYDAAGNPMLLSPDILAAVENAQLTATAVPERDAEIARLRDEIAALKGEKQTLNAGLPVPLNTVSLRDTVVVSPVTPGAQSIVVPPAETDDLLR